MTAEACRQVLSGPLVFGNPEQIAARTFLIQVAACRAVISDCAHAVECRRCKGRGRCEHTCNECDQTHTGYCQDCDGSGRVGPPCPDCLAPFAPDVIAEARR